MVYNGHSLIHIPSDFMRHAPLDTFSCLPYESMMWFRWYCIHGPRNPTQQLYRELCESVAAGCLSATTMTMDDSGMTRFRRSRNLLLFREMVLSCALELLAAGRHT